MKKNLHKIIWLLVISFSFFHCTVQKEFSNNLYEMKKNNAGLTFLWKEKLILSRDSQSFKPLNFQISLPPGLKKFSVNEDLLIFEYQKNQIIFIKEPYFENLETVNLDFELLNVVSEDEALNVKREYNFIKKNYGFSELNLFYSNNMKIFMSVREENKPMFHKMINTIEFLD